MKLTVLGWQGPIPGAGGTCSGYSIAHRIDLYAPDMPKAAFSALDGQPYDVKSHADFSSGPFAVSFFPTRRPVPSSAVRVICDGKTFAYTGDANTCPGLADFCAGADLLLADAGLCEAARVYPDAVLARNAPCVQI